MNKNYQQVLAFFQERFPDANEQIFTMVANNRLQSLGIKEKIEEISAGTAAKLTDFFKTLSPEELQQLAYSSVSQLVS